jgi:Spy/CpxP family protein refolding chaperone
MLTSINLTKMKKSLSIIIAFLFVSLTVFGQQRNENRGKVNQDKIKAIKVGLITDELNLTESQAEKFWPVYNSYSDKRKEILQQIRKRNKDTEEVSDKEILQNQDEILKLKQKELDLEKDYRDDFLKVITAKQYNDLQLVEKKFNQMLLNKLKERKESN